jgi:hypothetical protein
MVAVAAVVAVVAVEVARQMNDTDPYNFRLAN